MTNERKPPSMLARAESKTRHVIIALGLGMLSFVIGSIVATGLAASLGDLIARIENATVEWAIYWALRRSWLLVLVPGWGYAAGRVTQVRPLGFSIVAVLGGETFSVLLSAAINGFEALVFEPADVVVRLLTLVAGIGFTAAMVSLGRRPVGRAQTPPPGRWIPKRF